MKFSTITAKHRCVYVVLALEQPSDSSVTWRLISPINVYTFMNDCWIRKLDDRTVLGISQELHDVNTFFTLWSREKCNYFDEKNVV